MPDSVANFLTLTAAGDVGADFAGHVSAAGLDLDLTLDGAVVADQNRIQWKRATDGAGRGGMYATQLAGNVATILDLYALSPDAVHYSEVRPRADNAGGAGTKVEVQADAITRTLLAANGDSNYLRQEGFVQSAAFAGPWGGAGYVPPPTGTSGVTFTARASSGLIICWCTGAVTANTGMRVAVWLNGFNQGEMMVPATTTTGVHFTPTPFAGIWSGTPGQTMYVYFQTVTGYSDANDRGGFVVIQ